jgi:hypothetical protein
VDIRGYFRKGAYDHYLRGSEPTTVPDTGRVWLLALFWLGAAAMGGVTAALLSKRVPIVVRAVAVESLPGAGAACPAPALRVQLAVPGMSSLSLAEGAPVRGKVNGRLVAGRVVRLRPPGPAPIARSWTPRLGEACLTETFASAPPVAAWAAELTVAQVTIATRPVAWYFRRMLQIGDLSGASR